MEGTQAQGVRESVSFQVREWGPNHKALGTGLLSYPNLRVGLALRTVVELRSKGIFQG